jgi:hypothetical protein
MSSMHGATGEASAAQRHRDVQEGSLDEGTAHLLGP